MNSIYGFIAINTFIQVVLILIKSGGCCKFQLLKVQIIIEVSLLAKSMASVSTTHKVNLGLFCHFHDRSGNFSWESSASQDFRKCA